MTTAERLMDRHRRDAILLHRPYPPHTAPRTNSRFGGLPSLPAHYEWPRTPEGMALHFLAQVDLADLPFHGPLPERGVLFFFGRDDEEQIWDTNRPAAGSAVVLYALDAFAATPRRAAPDDLPAIGGYYPRPHARDLLRPGEPGPSVHVAWPIQPLRIDSWPDAGAFDDDAFGGRAIGLDPRRWFDTPRATLERAEAARIHYAETVEARRAAAFRAATGARETPPGWYVTGNDVTSKLFGDDADAHRFPERWLHADLFARAARAYLTRQQDVVPDQPAVLAEVDRWIARAIAPDPRAAMPAAERDAFRAWMGTIRHPNSPPPIAHPATQFLVEASIGAIRRFAADPADAALIADDTYATLAPFFDEGGSYGPYWAQMLGHAPSSQEARGVDDPTICLLNLQSDSGLGWMFGDVGEATFWIDPPALAARAFDRAWATIEGH